MGKAISLHGLYVITPEFAATNSFRGERLEKMVVLAIHGGARIVQYRDKSNDDDTRRREAQALRAVCRRFDVVFIINDDVELALTCGADGVHLGGEDMDLPSARARLGPGFVIGASCYNEMDRAMQAQQEGADYVAFGRFFPSRSKPHAVRADLELLRVAKRQLTVPIVAIGGITAQNGEQLVAAGADMLAVIDAVFGQKDVRAAAHDIAQCFQ
jgi:thiamine-phosphate pyrophosphorylase